MGDSKYFALFDRAERRRSCVIARTGAERRALDRLVGRGLIVRPRTSLFCRRAYWQKLDPIARHVHVVRALQALHPDWAFCRTTAACVFGLPVPYGACRTIHVVSQTGSRTDARSDVARHTIRGDRSVVVKGIRVTSLARTAFDCARSLPFPEALAIADDALRRLGWPPGRLDSVFASIGNGLAGVERARYVAAYADPSSESGGESIARGRMIEDGFQLPYLQVPFDRPDGRGTYRVDFLWRLPSGEAVIGELDGARKYVDPRMANGRSPIRRLAAEQHRESALTLYRIPILRISYREATCPPALIRKLTTYGIPRDPVPCFGPRARRLTPDERRLVSLLSDAGLPLPGCVSGKRVLWRPPQRGDATPLSLPSNRI